MQAGTYFSRRFLLVPWSFASHEKQSSLWKMLVLFLGMGRYKNWAHKIGSWKYWTIWRPVLPVFLPEHRVSHFCSTHWTPFRGYWRSAAAAAHNLILVEVDGKCPRQAPICSWHIKSRVWNKLNPSKHKWVSQGNTGPPGLILIPILKSCDPRKWPTRVAAVLLSSTSCGDAKSHLRITSLGARLSQCVWLLLLCHTAAGSHLQLEEVRWV